jgi:Cys-tRNA(Pro)/Cys-tRNA(Cys) deacylase
MDLKEYLKENNIWHKFIEKMQESGHTIESARLSGVDANRLAKSLVLLDEDKKPYLIIIPGPCKLDFNKVRKVFNTKKLHLAPFDQAKNYSGYDPGETPPIHHLIQMKVGLDKRFTQYETMYGGGGDKKLIVELKVIDVIRLNNAIVDDFSE